MKTGRNRKNIGESNYSDYKIQVWDIWKEYDLNPWDADIIKRTLRSKTSDSRIMDYEKIIHICEERIRQIVEEDKITEMCPKREGINR